MTCRELVAFLLDYFEGQLAQGQRTKFEEHLKRCPPCLAYLKSYQQTVEMGKTVCHNLGDDVPADVPEELVQAILASQHYRKS